MRVFWGQQQGRMAANLQAGAKLSVQPILHTDGQGQRDLQPAGRLVRPWEEFYNEVGVFSRGAGRCDRQIVVGFW